MRKLFFLIVVLLLASFSLGTVDACNVYTTVSDCNYGGGLWCSNQPSSDDEGNDLRCRCIFSEDDKKY